MAGERQNGRAGNLTRFRTKGRGRSRRAYPVRSRKKLVTRNARAARDVNPKKPKWKALRYLNLPEEKYINHGWWLREKDAKDYAKELRRYRGRTVYLYGGGAQAGEPGNVCILEDARAESVSLGTTDTGDTWKVTAVLRPVHDETNRQFSGFYEHDFKTHRSHWRNFTPMLASWKLALLGRNT